jgi:hypothetical protein
VTFDVIPDRSPSIENIGIAAISGGAGVTLHWMAVSGESYGVKSTTNLVTGSWINVTNGVSGNDDLISITNVISGDQQFFRVYLE